MLQQKHNRSAWHASLAALAALAALGWSSAAPSSEAAHLEVHFSSITAGDCLEVCQDLIAVHPSARYAPAHIQEALAVRV